MPGAQVVRVPGWSAKLQSAARPHAQQSSNVLPHNIPTPGVSLACTATTGILLGERRASLTRTAFGVLLVVVGSFLCSWPGQHGQAVSAAPGAGAR